MFYCQVSSCGELFRVGAKGTDSSEQTELIFVQVKLQVLYFACCFLYCVANYYRLAYVV